MVTGGALVGRGAWVGRALGCGNVVGVLGGDGAQPASNRHRPAVTRATTVRCMECIRIQTGPAQASGPDVVDLRLVADRLINHIQQRLAGAEAAQVLHKQLGNPQIGLWRRPGDMRRDPDIRLGPERVIGREWFGW